MTEEIISPPFPTDKSNIHRLITLLTELRAWVIQQRFWANEAMASRGIVNGLVPDDDEIPEVPDIVYYCQLAVHDIASTFVSMRNLRENWDGIVRMHEDSWDCEAAVYLRLRAVNHGYMLLKTAFVLPEVREARKETSQKRMRQKMQTMFKKLGVPDELLPGSSFSADNEGFGISIEDAADCGVNFDQLFFGGLDDEEGTEDEYEEGDERSDDDD